MRMHNFKAELFKTLSHPTRLSILDALRGGELTVGDVQEKLEVAQSSASQHLAALRARVQKYAKDAEFVIAGGTTTTMHLVLTSKGVASSIMDLLRGLILYKNDIV